jgi:hypothetical protein
MIDKAITDAAMQELNADVICMQESRTWTRSSTSVARALGDVPRDVPNG